MDVGAGQWGLDVQSTILTWHTWMPVTRHLRALRGALGLTTFHQPYRLGAASWLPISSTTLISTSASALHDGPAFTNIPPTTRREDMHTAATLHRWSTTTQEGCIQARLETGFG